MTVHEKNRRSSVENFTRSLLATTCLTVACGIPAVAATITEGVSPAPGDFPSSGNGYLLPIGTTVVNGDLGFINDSFDESDFFEFQGLVGGSSFSITGNGEGAANINMEAFNDTGGVIDGGFINGGETLTGIVPDDGNLDLELYYDQEGGLGTYQVTIDAQQVASTPEPSTLGTAALALSAGALAWRRRRS